MISSENKPVLTAVFAYPELGMSPATNLVVGKSYVVEDVEMNSWYTNISLRGHPGVFNSIQFVFFEDGEPVNIYSMPRYNPYLHVVK